MRGFLALAVAGAAACATTSCGSSAAGDGHVDTLALAGIVLIEDDALRMPIDMAASDTRLFVRNAGSADTLVDEFDLDGKFVKSFLTKGNGPNEVPYLDNIRYEERDNRLVAESNAFSRKLVVVDSVNNASPRLRTVFSFPERVVGAPNDTVVPGSLLMQLENGVIVASNLTPEGMLAVYSHQGRFKKFVQPYPDKSDIGENTPDYALPNFFGMIGGASPDGKHFATVSKLGDIIAIGSVDGDSVSIVTKEGRPQRGISISSQNENYFSFEYNDDLEMFYPFGVKLSNKHVYAIAGSKANDFYAAVAKMKAGEDGNMLVRVYDFDGKLVKVLQLDHPMGQIAVTPDDSRLFLFVESEDNGYQIFTYEL